MVSRVLSGTTHSKFIQIGLTQNYRILSLQLLHNSSIIWWHEFLKNLRCTGSFNALSADIILDSPWNTLQESNLLTLGDFLIYSLGLSQSLLTGNSQICLHITLYLIDSSQYSLSQLQRGNFFIYQHVMEDMGRLFKQFHSCPS